MKYFSEIQYCFREIYYRQISAVSTGNTKGIECLISTVRTKMDVCEMKFKYAVR